MASPLPAPSTLSKTCLLTLAVPSVSAFVASTSTVFSNKYFSLGSSRIDPSSSTDTVAPPFPVPERWASHALLFSSLSDGVITNARARSFLRFSVAKTLVRERITRNEDELRSSVEFSPCNGPSMECVERLHSIDRINERGQKFSTDDFESNGLDCVDSWANGALNHLLSETNCDLNVRVLFIPTAMYALNPHSSSTPGKQRQRARADGKKRRTQFLSLLGELLSVDKWDGLQPNLLAVTLDLDDGSLKQPVGSEEDASLFPEDDCAALSSWHPHVIYFEGGNTFWLQHCIDKGGYSTILKDAVCTESQIGAVYCGKSAGAIIAGGSVATATWKGWDDPSIVPGKGVHEAWLDCQGLRFVGNQSFFPHMSDDWKDLVKEKLESSSWPGSCVCLREQEAYCVIGDKKVSFNTSGPTLTK